MELDRVGSSDDALGRVGSNFGSGSRRACDYFRLIRIQSRKWIE